MYTTVLALHSLFRWLVLLCLLYAIYRAYRGWLRDRAFSKFDNTLRHSTATVTHIQLILGVWLYFISPTIDYFLNYYQAAVKVGDVRFFGMEHNIMMLIAITIITIGSAKAKRKPHDKEKFKVMAIWFTVGLIIILLSIPWPFSPLAARPYFRSF